MFDRYLQADLEVLVKHCLRGDQSSWTKLVDRFQSLVISIPKRLGLSTEECDDVFQATFVALSRGLDRIEHPSTLPKWISTTASRESFRIIRARSGQNRTVSLEESSLDQVLADQDRGIAEQVETALAGDQLRTQLEQLQTKCRDLLRALFLEDDVDYAEISKRLEIPVGSIGPTRARCIEKLRSLLAKSNFFEDLYQPK